MPAYNHSIAVARDKIPPDVEGPLLSESAIIAIIVGVVIFSTTFLAMFFFFRWKKNPPQTDARRQRAHLYPQPAVEMDSWGAQITVPQHAHATPQRAFTYDQDVPVYPGKGAKDPPPYLMQAITPTA